MKPLLPGRLYRLPTDKLPVTTKNHLLYAPRKVLLENLDQNRDFLPSDGLPSAKLARKIFARLLNKTQYRPETLLPSMVGVMPLTPPLLTAVNRLHRRVYIDMDHR